MSPLRVKLSFIMLVVIASSVFVNHAALKAAERKRVTVKSSVDGTDQPCYVILPEGYAEGDGGTRDATPLVVSLHSWSGDVEQRNLPFEAEAERRGWIYLFPHFRGRNDHPEACGSELAQQDILDAVAWARKNYEIDPQRIYLTGSSGGGHMTLLMVGRHPQVWAAASAWVGISDLTAWHQKHAGKRYGEMIEACCGGPPGMSKIVDEQYRLRSPLTHLHRAGGVPIDIAAGIHDGHTGSVPISHSLRAFNILAKANDAAPVTEKEMAELSSPDGRLGEPISSDREEDDALGREIHLRRTAGPARVTIFEGGHEGIAAAAFDWLSRHRKAAKPTNPQSAVQYERDIRPMFAAHCVKCHGADRREAGLRLDSVAGWRSGGDSGPAIRPSAPLESRLFAAVTGSDEDVARMPPDDETPLSEQDIEKLRRWIEQGAQASDKPTGDQTDSVERTHWAFQPIVQPRLPSVRNAGWIRNPIDAFILVRLERESLEASSEADRRTLIRRLSLDLRGLPPSIDEIRTFESDSRPDAYERLVDRYLASPAFGERWGRYWLDVARYADSNGYTRDFGREIWKYRDWVIHSVNANQPFDTFTIEQMAGDLLPDATLAQRVATGFHRNTLINEEGGTDAEQFRIDAVADRVATTGSAFLGLTLGCARCHQHKYDPISQREYYQIFAFLNNCEEPEIDAPSQWEIDQGLLDLRDSLRRQVEDLEDQLAARESDFLAAQLQWEETITPEQRATLPGPVQASLDLEAAKRDDTQKQLVAELFKKSDEAQEEFPEVAKIAQLKAESPVIPTTMVLRERQEARITHIHKRGNFLDHGIEVSAAVPAVLPAIDSGGQANRLDFARWLVSADNPLTPRVTVNRFWQRLFGRGLVETEDDFGTQGSPPTHPGLLDWLAVEFRESGWDRKRFARLVVTSATYRQSSRLHSELAEIDPRNNLLARQSRLRLDAEIIRDSALMVGNLLSRQVGGPSVHPPQPDGVFDFTQDPKPWPAETGTNRYRRGMYTRFWRSSPYPGLMVFDFPDSNVTCTRRVRSNTPLQALTLANDRVYLECAHAVGSNVVKLYDDDEQRLQGLFWSVLGRSPSSNEAAAVRELVTERLQHYSQNPEAADAILSWRESLPCDEEGRAACTAASWIFAARVLLNLDEFITRE